VDAVDARPPPRLQLLGRGDIGEDHELLDQPVAVEALARLDRHRVLLGIEHDAILDQVERERATRGAGPVKRRKRAIERAEPVRADRQGREAIARRLDLFVGEPRRRAHERALEAVTPLAARSVDP
jgi:hypothetical protein